MRKAWKPFGSHGETRRLKLLEEGKEESEALLIYRCELRSRAHTSELSSFFREIFVADFNSSSPSLDGKSCLYGCTHKYGAQAGEGQVYTHVTSANSCDRSAHEENVLAADGSVQRGIAGFFRPAAPSTMLWSAERRCRLGPENQIGSPSAGAAAVVLEAERAPGASHKACLGFRPSSFSSFPSQYPWKQHTVMHLPWNASTENGGSLFNMSPPCLGEVSDSGSRTCGSCAQLAFSTKLATIVATAISPLSATSGMNGQIQNLNLHSPQFLYPHLTLPQPQPSACLSNAAS